MRSRWLAVLWLSAAAALASGPRYVTGPPFFTGPAGVPVGWANRSLQYSTDAGDLSANVNRAAADALVASAAAVWNVPVANLSLRQGGVLAEDVSGANVYVDSTGVHYPADVSSGNAGAVPIAVIYDADGSVTDTLLGAGASDPSGCRQNAVTESVDLFDPAGYILHAVVILNGRCTGPAAAQQMQMQYQLERVFGRVLGLGWSQANDNVFTGTPVPTYQQALHWPIMHPVDILCGAYTYQCLPQPFQLRTDDLSSLVLLYGIAANASPGKQVSLAQATAVVGHVSFPAGEGMAGVNVVGQRINLNETDPEPWVSVSGVSGALFREAGPTPVRVADSSPAGSLGTLDGSYQGYYELPYVPVEDGNQVQAVQVSTEAVNPLYTGSYAVGPYVAGQVAASGSAMTEAVRYQGLGSVAQLDFRVPDAAAHCGTGMDGTEAAPAQADASGWSTGVLCGYGHAAWMGVDVLPNRTLTVEVTALDEQGYGTTSKAMPVIGAWADGDTQGSLPTLGVVASAFNSLESGMSSMIVDSGQASRLRVAVADERGDGRPDFAYQARLFYAGSVFPARVPVGGGTVTVSGTGFRLGNEVLVNGIVCRGVSWTANALTVTVPSLSTAGAAAGVAVDVGVVDSGTGASSTIPGGLTYDNSATLPNSMKLVSAPAGTVYVGDPATVAFAVQVLKGDGVTPVAGEAVALSAGSGAVSFGVCGGAACTVTTDARGIVSTTITATSAGRITLQAADGALVQTAPLTAIAKAGSVRVASAPSGPVYAGQTASTSFTVQVLAADGTPMQSRAVVLSVTAGSASFAGCAASICEVTTDVNGMAGSYVMPGAAGAVTLQAADGAVVASASFNVLAGQTSLRITSRPPATIFVDSRAATPFDVVLLGPDGVTPLAAKTVVLSAQLMGSGGSASPGVTYSICNTMTCPASTDYQGQVATWVDVHTAGTYLLQAAYGGVTVSTTIQVLPRVPGLRIVSAPSGSQLIGSVTATPFRIQTLDYDGVTPLPGQYVTISAIPGTVGFDACSVSSCLVVTDANGYYTMQVTPLTTGTVTLEAVMVPIVLQASFTGVQYLDAMQLVSQPGGNVYAGQAAATPFSVRVFQSGGATPIAGRSVTLSVTGGSAVFAACGQATCTLTTDADGVVSSGVTPLSPGTVTLLADDGGVTRSVSFSVLTNAEAITTPAPQRYIAENVSIPVNLTVSALLNGVPAVNQPVLWTGSSGFSVAASGSATDANGIARMAAVAGPLKAGTQAGADACGWTTTCVHFQAKAVSAADWAVSLVSGGEQSVSHGTAFVPVVAEIVDLAGHPVAGALVTVYQAVRPVESCSGQGRCPVGPVLASSSSVAVSGEDGSFSIIPIAGSDVSGRAEETEIAITAGLSGYLSTTLQRGP